MNFEDFKLERFFAKHEFTAKHLISCSDAESVHLSELLDLEPGTREKMEKLWLGYSDSQGIPELRAEISKLYKTIQPEQILAHTGAQEPILNLLSTVLGPKDHVITHFPSYQSNYSIPRAIGCEVSFWRGKPSEGWRLDLGELEKLIQPNTKLVILNCPHNPSGYVMAQSEFLNLVEILRKHGILLLTDEVYRGLELDPAARLPQGADAYENAISLGVMSKGYGLAGLRVGWIATRNEKVLSAMKKQKDYTTICNPIVTEWLSALALRHGEFFLEKNRRIVVTNIRAFEDFLARHGATFDWMKPQGGTMGFAWRKDGKSIEPFAQFLMERYGLMLISGKYFDFGEEYFRLGLGRLNFPETLQILEKGLLEFKSR